MSTPAKRLCGPKCRSESWSKTVGLTRIPTTDDYMTEDESLALHRPAAPALSVLQICEFTMASHRRLEP